MTQPVCQRCNGSAIDPEYSSPAVVYGDHPEPENLEPCIACQLPSSRIPLDDMTSDALDALYAELENLRLAVAGADHVSAAWARKLRKAEAELHAARDTLERVRKLGAEWADPKYRGQRGIPHVLAADVLRAALDEHQEQT